MKPNEGNLGIVRPLDYYSRGYDHGCFLLRVLNLTLGIPWITSQEQRMKAEESITVLPSRDVHHDRESIVQGIVMLSYGCRIIGDERQEQQRFLRSILWVVLKLLGTSLLVMIGIPFVYDSNRGTLLSFVPPSLSSVNSLLVTE